MLRAIFEYRNSWDVEGYVYFVLFEMGIKGQFQLKIRCHFFIKDELSAALLQQNTVEEEEAKWLLIPFHAIISVCILGDGHIPMFYQVFWM